METKDQIHLSYSIKEWLSFMSKLIKLMNKPEILVLFHTDLKASFLTSILRYELTMIKKI